jgi:hypothetical protein
MPAAIFHPAILSIEAKIDVDTTAVERRVRAGDEPNAAALEAPPALFDPD